MISTTATLWPTFVIMFSNLTFEFNRDSGLMHVSGAVSLGSLQPTVLLRLGYSLESDNLCINHNHDQSIVGKNILMLMLQRLSSDKIFYFVATNNFSEFDLSKFSFPANEVKQFVPSK